MKTRLSLILITAISLTFMAFTAFATEDTADPVISAVQIQGVMQQSEDGLSLVSEDSTYQLKGCESIEGLEDDTLKGMVGKLVKVSGDLEQAAGGIAINVKELKLVN